MRYVYDIDFPTPSTDPTSGVSYQPVDIGESFSFNRAVPAGFETGTPIYIDLQVSTPGTAVRHKWQVTATLIRRGTDSTGVAASQTSTLEVTSGGVANVAATESILVCDSAGAIDSRNPSAGDTLAITIERIAATTNEDSNPIKILTLQLRFTADQASVSGCIGRVGKIIDRVYLLLNEQANEHFTNAQIIDFINEGYAELAEEELFKTTTLIDLTEDTVEYPLLTLIPTLERVYRVRPYPQPGYHRYQEYRRCQTRQEYDEIVQHNGIYRDPLGYSKWCFVESNVLYLWPRPPATVADGLEIYHSLYPGGLDCESGVPPAFPSSHDKALRYYALKEAFLRDATNVKAGTLTQYYAGKYQEELAKLIRQSMPTSLGVRPG